MSDADGYDLDCSMPESIGNVAYLETLIIVEYLHEQT